MNYVHNSINYITHCNNSFVLTYYKQELQITDIIEFKYETKFASINCPEKKEKKYRNILK